MPLERTETETPVFWQGLVSIRYTSTTFILQLEMGDVIKIMKWNTVVFHNSFEFISWKKEIANIIISLFYQSWFVDSGYIPTHAEEVHGKLMKFIHSHMLMSQSESRNWKYAKCVKYV